MLASSEALSGGLWTFKATNFTGAQLAQPLEAELDYILNTSIDFPAFDFALSQVGYFVRADGGTWLSLVDVSVTNNDLGIKVDDLVSKLDLLIPGGATKTFDVLFFVGGKAVSDTSGVDRGIPFEPGRALSAMAIPEPTTFALILFGFYFILFTRTQQRSSGRNNVAQIPGFNQSLG
jgi:hypothetical protein